MVLLFFLGGSERRNLDAVPVTIWLPKGFRRPAAKLHILKKLGVVVREGYLSVQVVVRASISICIYIIKIPTAID
jgi:hypothetical protein